MRGGCGDFCSGADSSSVGLPIGGCGDFGGGAGFSRVGLPPTGGGGYFCGCVGEPSSDLPTGEWVFLRRLGAEDLDILEAWENDPRVWAASDLSALEAGDRPPFSREALRQFIDNQQHDFHSTGQQRLVVCVVDAGVNTSRPVSDIVAKTFASGVGTGRPASGVDVERPALGVEERSDSAVGDSDGVVSGVASAGADDEPVSSLPVGDSDGVVAGSCDRTSGVDADGLASCVTDKAIVAIDASIRREASSRAVGFVDLFDFDPVELSAGLGMLIYDMNDRGKGYGSAALKLLCGYAERVLGLRRLWCRIQKDNIFSTQLFRGKGFALSLDRDGVVCAETTLPQKVVKK